MKEKLFRRAKYFFLMLDADFIVFYLLYMQVFHVVKFVGMKGCKFLFVVSILKNMKIFDRDT